MNQKDTETLELFRTADVMRAMLDNGYKSTDYAIAEIIDNSIEAQAKHIDILVFQSSQLVKQRNRSRISKIAIVDDGCGMLPSLLSKVLTFGYGTHSQNYASLKGSTFGRMGKYGFGLPNSSSSQSDVVHVYSWQNGLESTYKTSLFVQRIIEGIESTQRRAVPENIPSELRQKLESIGHQFGSSGTLVLWDECVPERSTWKVASTLIDKTERTCGRIFRKFIDGGHVVIRMALFNENSDKPSQIRQFRANDPLFLMQNTIADSLLDDQKYKGERPFFNSVTLNNDFDVPVINNKGEEETARVEIRASIARVRTLKRDLNSDTPGGLKIGVLAAENEGVSVLRAGRELELSKTWVPNNYDTRHRWWGVEIEFPPALDKIFGVTNNKQSAIKLESYASQRPDDILKKFTDNWRLQHPEDKGHITYAQMIQLMQETEDEEWVLCLVAKIVHDTISEQYKVIKTYLKESGTKKGNKNSSGEEETASNSTGTAGKDPNEVTKRVYPDTAGVKDKPTQEKVVKDIYPENPVQDQDLRTSQIERLKKFLESEPDANFFVGLTDVDSNAFFECRESNGLTAISFNRNHPAYERLLEAAAELVVEDENLTLSNANVQDRVDDLKLHILLMFFAWAKTELALTHDDRMVARAIKEDWGRNFYRLIKAFDEINS